jgi:hypothetical protein
MPSLTARPPALRAPDLLFLAALTALALATGLAPITNNDIWLHLATGRWMLENGRVPWDEVFSFVAAGRPYVAHEWGSELIFIFLHKLAGIGGLVAFKAGMSVALAAAVYLEARNRRAAPLIAAPVTGLAVFVAGAHMWVRPHLLTWGAVLLSLAILRRARTSPVWLAALIPLQVVWTNLHGGYVLGPVLILGWAAGEAVSRFLQNRRRSPVHGSTTTPERVGAGRFPAGGTYGNAPLLASVAVAAGLSCLVNPYGLELLRLPFELTGSEVFMQAVYEWRSPLTSAYGATTMFAGFLILVALLALGVLLHPRRLDPCDAIVLLGFLALALRMNRNVPLFGLVAAPVIAVLLSPSAAAERRGPRPRLLRAGVAALLLAVAAGIAWSGYPYAPGNYRPRGLGPGPQVPVAAVEYVESGSIAGNAFTTYGEGAYAVWKLWPRVRVSMDSRNSVYGEDLYRSYRAALRSDEGMTEYLHTWSPDLAVVSHRGPFRRGFDPEMDRDHDLPHRAFLASGGLALVEFDDVSAVYLARTPENEELTRRDSYQVIHPVLLPPVFPEEDLPLAVIEGERAVARHPRALVARWILANAYAQSHRPEDALEQLAVLSRLDRETAARWGVGSSMEAARLGLTGLMEWQAGRCEAARRALEEALRIDPDYGLARELLAHLDC